MYAIEARTCEAGMKHALKKCVACECERARQGRGWTCALLSYLQHRRGRVRQGQNARLKEEKWPVCCVCVYTRGRMKVRERTSDRESVSFPASIADQEGWGRLQTRARKSVYVACMCCVGQSATRVWEHWVSFLFSFLSLIFLCCCILFLICGHVFWVLSWCVRPSRAPVQVVYWRGSLLGEGKLKGGSRGVEKVAL